MTRLFLSILGACLLTCGCSMKEEREGEFQASWPNAVTYEIFVQSFSDSDGDGIGDINGVTQRLDYLTDLGIKAIWLMPIMPSPSYHKYDVTDYRNIHPDYGSLEGFQRLLDEAHQRDIKVIIDLIINHSSEAHPWFLEAKKGVSPYRDYYVWADYDSIKTVLAKKETSLDSDNITQWHQPGSSRADEHYYGFFSRVMPDLNFDSPALREEVYDIGKFWLELGVDGFRLDAAKHIYPDDRAEDNHSFWAEFRNRMKQINEEVYLIGEVWADSKTTGPYLRGLPALFNFELREAILQNLNEPNGSAIAKVHEQIRKGYQKYSNEFYDATILSNHDQNRILSDLEGDVERLKLAASILFSLPGTPYIYYGEELGMLGKKPDEQIREPFLWDEAAQDNERTKWIKPVYSNESTVVPMKLQLKDEASVLHHYRRLIRLRNQSRVLTLGALSAIDSEHETILIFKRHIEDEELLILHNPGNRPMVYALDGELADFKETLYKLGNVKVLANTVVIPPKGSVYLSK